MDGLAVGVCVGPVGDWYGYFFSSISSEFLLEEGVRTEMLLGLMGQNAIKTNPPSSTTSTATATATAAVASSSGTGTGSDGDVETEDVHGATVDVHGATVDVHGATTHLLRPDGYLEREVSYGEDRLLDAECNAVMMEWERPLMLHHAKAIAPTPGLDVLNVGKEFIFFSPQKNDSMHACGGSCPLLSLRQWSRVVRHDLT